MATVECPCTGCEYTDTVGGVEAHISGSTRDGHLGRSGSEFREQLIEQAQQVEGAAEGSTESAAAGLLAATVALAIIVVTQG
jgi:hypothetical protein